MSSPFGQGPNPYAATSLPPAPAPLMPAGPLQTDMEYMRAYNYIFENPNWLTSVLMMGLVCLGFVVLSFLGIGIIFQLLFLGYQFETIDWLLKTQGRQYPVFDFGRIGEYFSRGLWPFLVSFVATIVLMLVIGVVVVVFLIVGGAMGAALGDDVGGVIGGVFSLVAIAVAFVASIVATFYLTAMTLRSGLAQDFAAGFQFGWLQDFVGKMWLEMLLSFLFLGVTTFLLYILGLLAFCIGILFVIPLFLLAYAHILYQLYVVYLSRGGMPVPTKSMMYATGPQPPFAMPPGYPPKPPA